MVTEPDALDLLRKQLADSSYAAIAAQKAQQEAEDSATSLPGYFLEWDGSTGLAVIQLDDGGIIRAQSISIKSFATGDRACVTLTDDGTNPLVDGLN